MKRESESPALTKEPYDASRHYGTRYAERDKQYIPFGLSHRVSLYRRGDLKSPSWFMRMYIREEHRYFRKSLRTADREEAAERAVTEMLEILAKVRNGERILTVSLKDLLRRYALHQEEQIRQRALAPKTLLLHRHRLKLGREFLLSKFPAGLNTRISAIDGKVFDDYLSWRFDNAAKKGTTLRRDVVRDELLSIRKMFHFARRQKLCSEKSIPTWTFAVDGKDRPRRRRMTPANYLEVLGCFGHWLGAVAADESLSGTSKLYQRYLVFYVTLLIADTGMRSGEVFELRNSDVEVREDECVISIRPETSKVRRGRRITHKAYKSDDYNLKDWLNRFQRHRKPNHYLFASYNDGTRPARDYYYKGYNSFRSELKKAGLEWFDTYHCRHFWITKRLLAGEPIHIIAKAAGTSVAEIEGTYSHVLTEMATRDFANREIIHQRDGSVRVVS